MVISTRSDGHLWWSAASFHQAALGLQSSRLAECVELVRAQGLRGVFGRFPEFTECNIDVLGDLPNLEEVQLYNVELDDLEGLYRLPRLHYLRISGKRPVIDFGRLRTLSRLVVEHRLKDRGFDALDGLTIMNSWRYKPTQGTAFDLELPAALRELLVCWSSVETFSPLRPLPDLRDLHLARCRNLRNLRDLGNLRTSFPSLEQLTVEACGRLTLDEAERAISGHPALTRVIAANRLILRDRGKPG